MTSGDVLASRDEGCCPPATSVRSCSSSLVALVMLLCDCVDPSLPTILRVKLGTMD